VANESAAPRYQAAADSTGEVGAAISDGSLNGLQAEAAGEIHRTAEDTMTPFWHDFVTGLLAIFSYKVVVYFSNKWWPR
jgi:hypothetical protein